MLALRVGLHRPNNKEPIHTLDLVPAIAMNNVSFLSDLLDSYSITIRNVSGVPAAPTRSEVQSYR